METKKNLKMKHWILGIIFVVTGVLTFLTMELEAEEASYTTMSQASLPIVYFKTDAGNSYNALHGYTEEIDSTMDCEDITPIGTDRSVSLSINTYGTEVEGITYKVRDLDSGDLYESNEVKDFSVVSDYIDVSFTLKNLIDDDVKYSLEIVLDLERDKEAHYYANIIKGDSYDIQEYLDFVLNFNEVTFDSSRVNEIANYLETSSSSANDNFGHVDIYSSSSMITWGDLDPYLESDIQISVKDVNSEIAVICLEYRMGAENSYGSYDTYVVNEYYRVRKTSQRFYLLNYERDANQIFDAKNDLVTTTRIDLGITSTTEVNMLSDEDGAYNYFVNNGSLWCYSVSDNIFTSVFSFSSEDTDSVREDYLDHDFKLINVDSNGDATFAVMGYMNRGEHEGEVGISLYQYDYSDNIVNEVVFIPLNTSYTVLSENAGGIAYLNENKFYCLVDDTLYSIDISSLEIMEVVTDLVEGTYAVSEDGSTICYSTSGDLNNTDTLRIYNMANSSDYQIKADEGDSLNVIGFIDGDCAYGIAHKSDISSDDMGNEIFAMYKVCIVDSEYNVIKEYEQDGIYISNAEIDGKRVTLTRVTKSGDSYVSSTIDQLINKDENVVEDELSVVTATTTARLTETRILLFKAASSTSGVSLRASEKIVYNEKKWVDLDKTITGEGKYYVYAYGRYLQSYENLNTAISKAYDSYGYVLDNNANLVYRRYKSTQSSLSNLSITSSSSTIATAAQTLANYAGENINIASLMTSGLSVIDALKTADNLQPLSISGLSVDKLLNYVADGYPLVAKTGDNSYCIITAYDSDNITYIDLATSATETKTITAASKIFTEAGNVYLTYYK